MFKTVNWKKGFAYVSSSVELLRWQFLYKYMIVRSFFNKEDHLNLLQFFVI